MCLKILLRVGCKRTQQSGPLEIDYKVVLRIILGGELLLSHVYDTMVKYELNRRRPQTLSFLYYYIIWIKNMHHKRLWEAMLGNSVDCLGLFHLKS